MQTQGVAATGFYTENTFVDSRHIVNLFAALEVDLQRRLAIAVGMELE